MARGQCCQQAWTIDVLLQKHMPDVPNGVSGSGATWLEAVDADVHVPSVRVLVAEPALERGSGRALERDDALGRLSGAVVLKKNGDPIGRLKRRAQKPYRRI